MVLFGLPLMEILVSENRNVGFDTSRAVAQLKFPVFILEIFNS